MSEFNRKGYMALKVRDNRGSIRTIAVRKNGKLANSLRHKYKRQQRAQDYKIREYKQQLREAKRALPLAERAKVKLADL